MDFRYLLCNQRALPQKWQGHQKVEAGEDIWRLPCPTPPFPEMFSVLPTERILEKVPNKSIWDTGETEPFLQM